MASLRSKFVRWITGAYVSRINAKSANIPKTRRRWRAIARRMEPADDVTIEATRFAGFVAEWLTPPDPMPGAVLLYLHGGAYVLGDCSTHRQLVSHIARAASIRALLPEYRLAPEHPFPAAVEDAVSVYRQLLADGIDPAKIVIAGDSAGGGLTMALLLALRDAGIALPGAACLLSPWLDLAATGESMQTHSKKDPWFRPENMPHAASHYCREDQLKDPLVSPVYGDLGGLPPILIQVGEDEILLSDSTRAAEKIEAAGGRVQLDIWPDMWHVFQAFVEQMPESRHAIEKLGAYIRRELGAANDSKS